MNPEIKRKWVEALRSGRYRQARSTLHDPINKSHCCLGVLCEVVDPGFFETHDGDTAYPPREVLAAAGLSVNPKSEQAPGEDDSTGTEWHPLWRMNDDGETFDEIADYIEEAL